ncbi:MAG: carbon-nitrogen hydrolase family protein [Candidatus Omnitrophica bacterium]|nr:carbon-nitrogen hydrolase family protein [Candidatus Omnitrophota bacterium]
MKNLKIVLKAASIFAFLLLSTDAYSLELSSSLDVPKNINGKVSFLAVQQKLVDCTNEKQKTSNVERSFEIIRKFPGYDLYIFPELSVTGYARKTFEALHILAEPADNTGKTFKKYSGLAKEIQSYIIYSIPVYDPAETAKPRKYYIASFIVSPAGDLINVYKKNYLFTMEQEFFTPGWADSDPIPVRTFEINGVKLGIVICYDMRYPEFWREQSINQNVVSFVHILATAKDFSWNTWQTMICARAIENLSYIISLNRSGDIYGGSMFVQPGTPSIGEYVITPVLQKLNNEEGVIGGVMDKSLIGSVRAKCTIFKDGIKNFHRFKKLK